MTDTPKRNKLDMMSKHERLVAKYDLSGLDRAVLGIMKSLTVEKAQDGLEQDQLRVSQQKLVALTEATPKAVRNSITRLIDGGFVGIVSQGSSYAKQSNVYEFQWEPNPARTIGITLHARGETDWSIPAQVKPIRKRSEAKKDTRPTPLKLYAV